MENRDTLELAAGDWTATLLPGLGGSTASLRFKGIDILRPVAGRTADPLQTSNFPLVPYCNRISGGSFRWNGIEHRVPLNFGDHPHALHGLGWQAPWQVREQEETSVLLVHEHDGGPGWPWAYRAEQRIAIGENGLRVALAVTNLADEPAPFSLGFHPYFAAPPGTVLRAEVSSLWLSGPTCIPTRRVAADWFGDWSKGQPVERSELIDHGFGGWSGVAEVMRPDLSFTIRLQASPELANLHLYMPPGERFFCAEPVGNMPDALNRTDAEPAEGMREVAPGERLRATMSISASAPRSSGAARD